MTGFTDDERSDMVAAESDLRAEAATEQRFDRQLSKIGFPPQIAVTVRALIQANARRITMTLRQARSSPITEGRVGVTDTAGAFRITRTG